jgi:hypothetical protein
MRESSQQGARRGQCWALLYGDMKGAFIVCQVLLAGI